MKNNFSLFFILFIIFPHIILTEEIIFAWQMHRHGARAPYNGIINYSDIYKEHWIEKQELTDVGKRMLYLLGVSVRKRYIDKYHLLNETYSPQEILVRSTDVNRTIESVESLLQGLYPQGTGPSLKDKIAKNKIIAFPPNKLYNDKFDEIITKYDLNKDNNYYALPNKMNIMPIHLFYKPAHEFELYSSDICPGHKEINKAQTNRKEIKEFGEKLTTSFPNVFETLEGTKNKTILYDYWSLYKYADAYISDSRDQRNLNILREQFDFTESKFDLLKNYSREYLKMDYFDTNYPKDHPEISTMALSYTFHSIINWMENAKTNYGKNKNYIKYVLYSAHDSSVGALEDFMENYFNIKAEYSEFAESRFFELYKDDKDVYKVRYLRGDASTKIDIKFDEFKNKINEVTWSDEKVNEYCQFTKEDKKSKSTSIFYIVMICLAGVNALFLIILIILYAKKSKSSKDDKFV